MFTEHFLCAKYDILHYVFTTSRWTRFYNDTPSINWAFEK